jgi:hypothetical protein
MNNCDDRLASSVSYVTAARNKTAENAEGRGGSVKQPLRSSAHSAVNKLERNQGLFNLFRKWLMAKKINHRGHREHRESLFSSVSSVLSVVFRT